MQIKNNNIETISPEGKIFYTHAHWLRQWLTQFLGVYKDTEVEIKGIFDGKFKKKVVVKQFHNCEIDDYSFNIILKDIENGGVEINNWKFKTV